MLFQSMNATKLETSRKNLLPQVKACGIRIKALKQFLIGFLY